MSKISSLFFISLLSGSITLGAYKLFFEDFANTDSELKIKTSSSEFSNLRSVNYAAENTDFSKAAATAVDYVVHVKNITVSKYQTYSLQDWIYGYQPQTKEKTQIGTGSGVIISEDGYVVTNNHVIQNASELEVTLNNNKTYKATVIGTDSKMDIALLKLETTDKFDYATFANSDAIKVGEWVLAIGNPYNLNSTVTAGIVSAKARNLTNDGIQSFIQTDAAVNPGNSGGALVNTNGELIGINTLITSATGSYIGYSFAVPSNITKKIIEDIMQFGNVQHAALGVEGGELNSAASKELKLNITQGFYINKVTKDSGADKAGLKNGDIIIKLDDQKINSFSSLASYLNSKRPNDIVDLTYLRDNKEKTTKVTLTKKELIVAQHKGIYLEDIEEHEKTRYSIKEGIKISDIKNEEFKEYENILKNSIVLKIDGYSVKNVEQAMSIFSSKKENQKTRLEILTSKNQQLQLIL